MYYCKKKKENSLSAHKAGIVTSCYGLTILGFYNHRTYLSIEVTESFQNTPALLLTASSVIVEGYFPSEVGFFPDRIWAC
jgi:hypothetical protein